MLGTLSTARPGHSFSIPILLSQTGSLIAQAWLKPLAYPNGRKDPCEVLYRKFSDRVGDSPQTLILSLTRSIPCWTRVSGPSATKNEGKLQPETRPCRSGPLDPALGKGYNRGESLPFGEVELMEIHKYLIGIDPNQGSRFPSGKWN